MTQPVQRVFASFVFASVCAAGAAQAQSLEELLGIEGTAARRYFAEFSGMLKADGAPPDFDFDGRNRRPPKDPVNALLSLAYAMLAREWVPAIA